MSEFLDSLDVANRACDHLGQPHIEDVDEDTVRNDILSSLYGKLRRAELQRNVWRFSTRRVALRPMDATTYLLDPDDWSGDTTYSIGSIVKDTNGELWVSTIPDNMNNDPSQPRTAAWDKYFGAMQVSEYDSEVDYWAGELVYVDLANGSYAIFMSLQNSNSDAPNVADAWSATVTYQRSQVVSYGGYQWYSLIELNTNNTPAEAPPTFDLNAVYDAATTVTASDGFIYTCIADNTTGHDPTAANGSTYWTTANAPAAWSKTPSIYASATSWRPIYAAMNSLQLQYPIGAGPLSQTSTRNVYHLPAGYLKVAPQMPKQGGGGSFLGAPSRANYDDWEFEGDYIVTIQTSPILFRFVADIVDVTRMTDMFCEGLGARMALEGCEKITQSTEKLRTIAAAYDKFMGDARMSNAIEEDPVEPVEDDWVTCRI